MAINNNPIKSTVESFKQMNKVATTAIEAAADQICDFDGDKTGAHDVNAEVAKLSHNEKVALTVGTIATGGALPVVSLIVEGGAHAVQSLGRNARKLTEAVQEKYSHPPEKPLADKLSKALNHAGDKIEEAVDDLKDGRTLRDAKKGISRGVRDTFKHQTPAEKIGNTIKDGFEDAVDGVSDVIDDIKDGRMMNKIRHAFDD
jgi:hypothetical protein